MKFHTKSILLIIIITISHSKSFNNENDFETFESIDDNLDENSPQFTIQSKQLYDSGKHVYEVMEKRQKFYGNCWRRAIESLHTNCKQLNEVIQSRLSLLFTNCFLESVGHQTYPCDESKEVKDCVKHMSDKAFNSYTEFFTHTQSVCFYLKSELWQQNTESTIDRLTVTSDKVSHKLEDASNRLQNLNVLQQMSIDSQILINNELNSAKQTINEFKTSTSEQRYIVREILDRFIKLQDFVLIEISYGYSIIFMIISMIVVYFVTTPNRTNEARLWLFSILVINLFIERMIASYSVEDQLNNGLKSSSIVINERIWYSRKISLMIMFSIFLWFAITYKNYGFVNYNILNQHTMHLNNIQTQLNQLYRNEGLVKTSAQTQSNPIIIESVKEYSSESDSDFTDDSDLSSIESQESDTTEASINTCSTVSIVTSSSQKPCNEVKEQNSIIEYTDKSNILSPNDSGKGFYNLRPRKAIPLSNKSIKNESVDSFIASVEQSKQVSRINTLVMKKNLISIFSSDED